MANLLSEAIASLGRWQKVESYDGDYNAHEWLEELEETMVKMGYPLSSYVERAAEKLLGDAKSWYRYYRDYGLTGTLSWEDFKSAFLREFGLSPADWEERLVTCYQGVDETTQAYSTRFITYAKRSNRQHDPTLVTLYVRGLDQSMSKALSLFHRRNANSTLREVMREAAELGQNLRGMLLGIMPPQEPGGRRVRFEETRAPDRPRSPYPRSDSRREEERRYPRSSSNGSNSGHGGGSGGGGGGYANGRGASGNSGNNGNGASTSATASGNNRDRNERNLATPHDLARLHTQMSRLSLNLRDRSDGRRDRGRDRYGGELNMAWRDYESPEESLYPGSDSDYGDWSEGELLASEQKRFRDFDLGQRLPRSREPFSPDTRMEVDRRPSRHYTAGGRADESPAAKVLRPYDGGGSMSRPPVQRPVTAAPPPPRPAAAGLSRPPPPTAASLSRAPPLAAAGLSRTPSMTAAAAATAARGVREATARPLADLDRPRVTINTRAPGASLLSMRDEPRGAPPRTAATAQPQRAAPPEPKPAAPKVPPRTDPVMRSEETQMAEDVFAKIAAHAIPLSKAVHCDSRAILTKVGGKCLGLARSLASGAGGNTAKGSLLAAAAPTAPVERDSDGDSPRRAPQPKTEYQICRVRASCLGSDGHEVEQRTCADTGASNCVIARRAVSGLGLLNSIRDTRTKFYHANGSEDRAKGKVCVTVCLPGLMRAVEMYVSDADNYDLLLGNDFLGPIRADARYSNMTLEYDDNSGARNAVPIKITRSDARQRNVPLARLDTHVYVASASPDSTSSEEADPEEAPPDVTPPPQPSVATTPSAPEASTRRAPRRHHPGVRPAQLFLVDGGSPASAMAVDVPTPEAPAPERSSLAGSDAYGTSGSQPEQPPATAGPASAPTPDGSGHGPSVWDGPDQYGEPLVLDSMEITSEDLAELAAMLEDSPPPAEAPGPTVPPNSPKAKVSRQLFDTPADLTSPMESDPAPLASATVNTPGEPSRLTLAAWLDPVPAAATASTGATPLRPDLDLQDKQLRVEQWLRASSPLAEDVHTVTTSGPGLLEEPDNHATWQPAPTPSSLRRKLPPRTFDLMGLGAAGTTHKEAAATTWPCGEPPLARSLSANGGLPLKEILAATDARFGYLLSPPKEDLTPISPFTATDGSGGYLTRLNSPDSPTRYLLDVPLLDGSEDFWYDGATGLPLPRGKRRRKGCVLLADFNSPLTVWSLSSARARSPLLPLTEPPYSDDEEEPPPLAPLSDDESEDGAPAMMESGAEYIWDWAGLGWSPASSPSPPPFNRGDSGGGPDPSGGQGSGSRPAATTPPDAGSLPPALVELFIADSDGTLRRPSRDEVLSLSPAEHLQLAQEYGRQCREWRGPPDPNDVRVQTMRERWAQAVQDNTELPADLRQVLLDNYDLFALDDSQLGRTDWVEAVIDTGDAPPVCLNPYRHSRVETEAMEAEVRRMLGAGIVRHSTSAWSSPVVMVRKSDGTHRFCVDLRGVNNVTLPVRFPMPHVRDLIDTLAPPLGEQRVYSCMDLKSGFWQVGVQEPDRCKLAFQAPSGLYEFCVLPMGARASPALFQRLMTLVLRPVLASGAGLGYNPTPEEEAPRKCCVLFIDDICIWSPSQKEHAADVQAVLDLLRLAGLVLSLKKCKFGTPACQFLGHVVDGATGHITPSPDNVEAIRSYPRLRTVRQVKAFLGLTSYYREQVDHFANVALPLYQCLGRLGFHWGERQVESFETLKAAITSFPILRAPDFARPFTLATDFAKTAVAACLSQHDEGGREYVVSFASKKLNDTQANWSSTDGEAFAAMWAITKVYHAYLYGTYFTLVTDNSALTYIMKTKDLTGKLARYALKLAPYTFTIVHRAGRKNGNADGLSRLGHLRDAPSDEDDDSPRVKPKRRPAAAGEAPTLEELACTFEAETLLFMAGGASSPRYAEVCVLQPEPELERLPSLADGIGGPLFEDELGPWPISWRERVRLAGWQLDDEPLSQQLPATPPASQAADMDGDGAPNPALPPDSSGEQSAESPDPAALLWAANLASGAPPLPLFCGGGGGGRAGCGGDGGDTATVTAEPPAASLTASNLAELSTDDWWRQWWTQRHLPKASDPGAGSADGAATSSSSGGLIHLNMVEAGSTGSDEERPATRRRPLQSLAGLATRLAPMAMGPPTAATAAAAAPTTTTAPTATVGGGGSASGSGAAAPPPPPPPPPARAPSTSAAPASPRGPPPPYPGIGHPLALPDPWLRSPSVSTAAATGVPGATPGVAAAAAAAAPASATATTTPRRRQLQAACKPRWLHDFQGDDSVDTLARLACAGCHSRHPEWNMLMCDHDGCSLAYHTTCLSPPLDGVPEGDWLCPKHAVLAAAQAAAEAATPAPATAAATATAAAAAASPRAYVNPTTATAFRPSPFMRAASATPPRPELKPPPLSGLASSGHGTNSGGAAGGPSVLPSLSAQTPRSSLAAPSGTAGAAPSNTRASSDGEGSDGEDGADAGSDDDGLESAGSVLEIDGVPQFHGEESRAWKDSRLLQFLRNEDEFMPAEGEVWSQFYKEIQRVTKKAKRYYWEDKDGGTLWKRATGKRPAVRVLKWHERLPAIAEVHGRGHQGWRSCYNVLRNRFYWDGMAHDIRVYVATCAACQPSKHVLVRQAAVRPLEVVGLWRRVHLDLCGPYEPTERGERYVILAVDSWSKWPEVGLLPNKSSETTARWFYENFITRFGSPELVFTDRGGEWAGEFEALLQREHITHRRTQAYTPSTNGQCERLVGVLRHALIRHLQDTEERNWAKFVYSVAYSYRITPQSSTGASPALCLYGRELTTAAERPAPPAAAEDDNSGGEAALAVARGSEPATDEDAFAAEPQQLEARREALNQLAERVQARLVKAQEKQVRDHARRNIKNAMPKPRPAPPPVARPRTMAPGTGAYGAASEEEDLTLAPGGGSSSSEELPPLLSPKATPAARPSQVAALPLGNLPKATGGGARSQAAATADLSPRDQAPRCRPAQASAAAPGAGPSTAPAEQEQAVTSPIKTRRQRQQSQSQAATLSPRAKKQAAQAATSALTGLTPSGTPRPANRRAPGTTSANAKLSDYDARLAALPDLQTGDDVYRRRRPRNKLTSDREGPYAFQAFHPLLTHILVCDQNGLEFAIPLHDVFVPKHRC